MREMLLAYGSQEAVLKIEVFPEIHRENSYLPVTHDFSPINTGQ
jgi:hypothetical protein